MKTHILIRKTIVSEKATKLAKEGVYNFLVDERSTKEDIKKAVELHFQVTVKKVNVNSLSGKKKRIGKSRKFASVGGGKKAFVTIAKGQAINIFGKEKSEPKKSTEKENKK